MDYEDESYVSEDGNYGVDEDNGQIAITGAPIGEDALEQFLNRGRCIRANIHPYLQESFAWISGRRPPQKNSGGPDEHFTATESALYPISKTYEGAYNTARTQLVNDCAEIYESLQVKYNDDGDADVLLMVAESSRALRAKVGAVFDMLNGDFEQKGLIEADEHWRNELIDTIGILLCAESIYMTPEGTLLCDGLMSWVNRHNPQPTDEEGEDIFKARVAYQHPGFWDYISRGVVRGLFEMIGRCLADSGLTSLDPGTARATNDLCLLLRTCPRVSNYVNRAVEFRDRHKLWRAKVAKAIRELDIPDPEIAAAFRQIYELLKGDKDAVYRQCQSWQECLAALALLFDPHGVKEPADVRALFEMITESDDFGLAVDRTLPEEEACAALCSENIPKAITKARAVDLSLSVHLADLLDKAEVLDNVRSGDLELSIRDILVLEMGEFCIGQRGTSLAAFTYWRTAGDVGIDSIQQVIPRIPVTTQAEVDKLLTICNDLELLDEASEIESIWARKLEVAGDHNRAIVAYDRANNPAQIDRLNWRLLEDSLIAGSVTSKDPELRTALQSPETTHSDTICVLMAPYATLAMMYQLKESNDAEQAARHLSSLLTSSDLPKKYVPVLMAEMLPFISSKSTHFSLREIFDSLAAIEEYHDSDQYAPGLKLLESAMRSAPATSTAVVNWRSLVGAKFTVEDVLSLVRLQLARSIGTHFCA